MSRPMTRRARPATPEHNDPQPYSCRYDGLRFSSAEAYRRPGSETIPRCPQCQNVLRFAPRENVPEVGA
jgi:hypothetical protein